MSLEGTFETLALTEVLGLLSHSRKAGALLVQAGPHDGRLWVETGRILAVESGEQTGPVETPSELLNRAVDVCFALARQDSGSFRFVAGEKAPWGGDCEISIGEVLSGVEQLLVEWREIREVVPSIEARPRLRDELGADQITVDGATWRLLVAIDGRRTVRDVMHRSQRSVLEVCHALKDLVNLGAVEMVVEAPSEEARPRSGPSRVAPVVPYGPGVDSAAPVPAWPRELRTPVEVVTGPVDHVLEVPEPHLGVAFDPGAEAGGDEPEADTGPGTPMKADEAPETEPLAQGAADDGDGSRDRRALLRLFSGLRDG